MVKLSFGISSTHHKMEDNVAVSAKYLNCFFFYFWCLTMQHILVLTGKNIIF